MAAVDPLAPPVIIDTVHVCVGTAKRKTPALVRASHAFEVSGLKPPPVVGPGRSD
jgi:hypothetical protein